MSLILPINHPFHSCKTPSVLFRGGPDRLELLYKKFSAFGLLDTARKSKFGAFFNCQDFMFCGKLIHVVLLHKVDSNHEDEIHILFDRSVCRFGRREFGLITGLEFNKDYTLDKSMSSRRLIEKYFQHKDRVSFSMLRSEFKSCEVADDVWKLGLVYFVEGILLGIEDCNAVETDLLSLVDVPDNFFSYPWGERVFKSTLHAFQKDMKSWNGSSGYTLHGWAPVLQYWSFETVRQLGQNFADYTGERFPRMSSWTIKKGAKALQVIEVLSRSGLDVRPFLPARPIELEYLRRHRWDEVVDHAHVAAPASRGVAYTAEALELRRSYSLLQGMDQLRRSQSVLIDTLQLGNNLLQSQHEVLKSRHQSLHSINQSLDLLISRTIASKPQPTIAAAHQTTTTVDAPPTTSAAHHNTTTAVAQADILANDITPFSHPPQPQPQPLPKIPISYPTDGALSLSWVSNLMEAFKFGSTILPSKFPSVLPINALNQLVSAASEILSKEPNCVEIKIKDELSQISRVVVVGDLHGQLHDLLFLLHDAGYPGDDRVFVFNGDYVDRGAWGLETFLVLLAWKVFLPHRVFLLRGNHETKHCTSLYGFMKEVSLKYKYKGKIKENRVYKKCLDCFEKLPLASIIADRVYTAHGGLFRSVSDNQKITLGSLSELSKACRFVIDPEGDEHLIVEDILWSDPSLTPGLASNEGRGCGLLWGPDCTAMFLEVSKLKLIIRSHEGPDARKERPDLGGMEKGYSIDHDGLVTVVSAPDYPQFQDTKNRCKGAYIVLEPPHFDTPTFHSFDAADTRPKVNSKLFQ